jgi:hypothetical protein
MTEITDTEKHHSWAGGTPGRPIPVEGMYERRYYYDQRSIFRRLDTKCSEGRRLMLDVQSLSFLKAWLHSTFDA